MKQDELPKDKDPKSLPSTVAKSHLDSCGSRAMGGLAKFITQQQDFGMQKRA